MSSDSITDGFACPFCQANNSSKPSSWDKVGYIPIICVKCAKLFWARIPKIDAELTIVNRVPVFKVQIPELEPDTWVIIVNKQHAKHLEPGRITKRDHKHYRVEFNDGVQIWMPQHWVERIPWDVE
jgi:hypothetical protein